MSFKYLKTINSANKTQIIEKWMKLWNETFVFIFIMLMQARKSTFILEFHSEKWNIYLTLLIRKCNFPAYSLISIYEICSYSYGMLIFVAETVSFHFHHCSLCAVASCCFFHVSLVNNAVECLVKCLLVFEILFKWKVFLSTIQAFP